MAVCFTNGKSMKVLTKHLAQTYIMTKPVDSNGHHIALDRCIVRYDLGLPTLVEQIITGRGNTPPVNGPQMGWNEGPKID